MISDRESGVSKGFGFVTYDSIDAANNAIQYMNDQVIPIFQLLLVTKIYHVMSLFSFLLCFLSIPFKSSGFDT